MRRVFFESQTVEHQRIKVAHLVQCFLWNLAQVRCIREIVKTISHHRQSSMNYLERRNKQVFCKAKLCAAGNRMRDNLRQAAAKMRRLEDVFEDASYIDPRALVCVKPKRAIAKI